MAKKISKAKQLQNAPAISEPVTLSSFERRVQSHFRAGYPALFVQTTEDARARKSIARAIKGMDIGHLNPDHSKIMINHGVVGFWTTAMGLVVVADGGGLSPAKEMSFIELMRNLAFPNGDDMAAMPLVTMVEDGHLYMKDADPMTVSIIKQAVSSCRTDGRCFVMTGVKHGLPPELEKEMIVLDFTLPSKEDIAELVDNVAQANNLKLDQDERDVIISASAGLTLFEAEGAMNMSIVGNGKIHADTIFEEKSQIVKKSGLMEIIEEKRSIDDVGGLRILKDWIKRRKKASTEGARAYGLPNPKGVLVMGIPGTGKSLVAKAAASVLQRPLIRLDVGKLFGGLVGQSEGNTRSAIQTVEAMSPCVLWVDEINYMVS